MKIHSYYNFIIINKRKMLFITFIKYIKSTTRFESLGNYQKEYFA